MFTDKLTSKAKIASIQRTKTKLYDVLLGLSSLYSDKYQIVLSDIKVIYRALLPCFPKALRDSSYFHEALHRSVENYTIGHNLTTALKKTLSIRLAGNMQTMRLGTPICYPMSKTTEAYVLTKVVASTTSDDLVHFRIALEIITGPTAGDIIELKTTSKPMMKRIMRITGVYTKDQIEDEVFVNPAYLYGCYLFARPVETEGSVFIKDLGTSSSLKTRNKKLNASRVVKRICPRDFAWECSVCPIGADSCPKATHSKTAIRGICPRCGKEEWLNPEAQGLMSFNCQNMLW